MHDEGRDSYSITEYRRCWNERIEVGAVAARDSRGGAGRGWSWWGAGGRALDPTFGAGLGVTREAIPVWQYFRAGVASVAEAHVGRVALAVLSISLVAGNLACFGGSCPGRLPGGVAVGRHGCVPHGFHHRPEGRADQRQP
jgi:hypothetical protein